MLRTPNFIGNQSSSQIEIEEEKLVLLPSEGDHWVIKTRVNGKKRVGIGVLRKNFLFYQRLY